MFGSLVIVFPTPHEGGALHLRHRDQEWIFDSGQVLTAKGESSIGYAAFFSDIEHEVAPVTSVSKHLTPPLVNEGAFREAFTALLENPEFLAEGGTLAFGLRHVYPVKDDLKHVYNVLKGSDAVMYQSVHALGYEPVLYIYYENDGFDLVEGVLIDQAVDLQVYREPGQDLVHYLREVAEQLEWVTPMTTFDQQEDAFISYGNEATLDWIYGNVKSSRCRKEQRGRH
ncbi:hypothetical protein DFH94DRAFT_796273 [Russula ochroleuca]|uniref:Fe2OG dioxygenase domain-containing protein n=1 Tax=Russula ochroleuca TaxID=152965 RepID=A0A9P5JW26_9AGAM|nr:hypothetical protein DFH94DRAFT_796273 [Russula ochroleuca]